MRENQTTEFKRIQFLGNPFRAGQKTVVKKSDKKISEGIVKCDVNGEHKGKDKEKKLVAMISTSGKSKEQIKAEAIKAWRNYQQKKAEAEAKLKSELKKD